MNGSSNNGKIGVTTPSSSSNKNNSVTNSPLTDLYETSNMSSGNESSSHLNWSKTNLQSIFANINSMDDSTTTTTNKANGINNHDTISLNVDDDEKTVGILV